MSNKVLDDKIKIINEIEREYDIIKDMLKTIKEESNLKIQNNLIDEAVNNIDKLYGKINKLKKQ